MVLTMASQSFQVIVTETLACRTVFFSKAGYGLTGKVREKHALNRWY
jgi:hypothetical protein